MASAWDHRTGATGLTPTVLISKNGSAFESPAGAVSEIGNGWYKVVGNADDTDTLGPLVLHATAPGADPCREVYDVVAVDPAAERIPSDLQTVKNRNVGDVGEGKTAHLLQSPDEGATAVVRTGTTDAITITTLSTQIAAAVTHLDTRTLPSEEYATIANQQLIMGVGFNPDTDSLVQIRIATIPQGKGTVVVDHNYGGPEALAYKTSSGQGIDNAVIQAFREVDWNAGRRDARYIVASSRTNIHGHWEMPMLLDPATYVLLFCKQGSFGPDTTVVTVSE